MLSHRNITSDTFLVTYYMPLYESDVFYVILPIHHAYTMTAVLMETLSLARRRSLASALPSPRC